MRVCNEGEGELGEEDGIESCSVLQSSILFNLHLESYDVRRDVFALNGQDERQ
jgi:hypothetical protein